MQNQIKSSGNETSNNERYLVIKVCVVIPFFCIFLCFVIVMLYIFASHRQFLDTSRYILFACMLINDNLLVSSTMLLFLLMVDELKFAIVFCAPLLFVSAFSYYNTPLILATMSLERYVAICYPLQRPAAWRADRIWIIIVILCLISFIVPITDFATRKRDPAMDDFSTPVLCHSNVVNSSPIQKLFKLAMSIFFFAAVAVIILFTYVRILLETRKLRQDKSSVSKAMHTVLLHGFQLLLCMLAFTRPITETLIVANLSGRDIAFINYVFFLLIPRFLSPVIYGFRDHKLKSYIGKTLIIRTNHLSRKTPNN